jgi:predicted AAA+ superfamily ATPase
MILRDGESMRQKYLKRIADKVLNDALEASGAVLIEGTKWCGKTRTAEERAASTLLMQDPDYTESYLKAADVKPSFLLKGKTPRLLDEWQMAPVLWDAVRFAVDRRGESGQFILTGSAVPMDNAVKHTGTGRISRMQMRTMTLYESLESSGDISLESLFDGNCDGEGMSTLTIEKLAFALSRGGWPASVGEKESVALKRASNYVEAIINVDVSRVDGVEKNPSRVRALMRSLARNISTMATLATIRNDMAVDEDSLSEKTISIYLSALRRIFVVEDLPAWNPAMRSKTALRTHPKRHFTDPSIAAAVLRASPDSLLQDFETFGFLFESLCVRDLRVYAQAIDGEVFHFRDKSGLEADAVVQLKDGRWGAVEAKMGAKEIETAAENLKTLRRKVNLDKMKEPSFLMVLTGTELAYRREDGVYVAPIGCLKD